jgi:integrase
MLMLLVDTGARRAELVDLTLAHLDLDLDVLPVLGKGRRERALPFGHTAGAALDRYLRARPRHKDAALPWLWLGPQGRLTRWGLVQMLRRRGEQAGLPGLHPHQLRHSFAPPVAGRRRREDRPDAPGRLEVAGHAAALRGPRPPTPEPARPTDAFLLVTGSSGPSLS